MANGSKRLVGKAASFDIEDGYTYTFGAFMGAFRPIQTEGCELVFHLFQTNKFRNHIGVILAGSSINNLKPTDIEEFCIFLPKPTEQTRIATILSDMDEEITALETKLNKARQLKQGMMHNLLTGKIRLV